ncbi:GNAT family N-acetyltransferase [Flexivirga caeni]|uniref:GNAT family N-acetyltransferase n=1 Tax=Flexivirga caeni TaxID=2294115 RepID=A0A3M9M250_9MICO|nr:GNAT family N-acetyltransferase [Flexivirga caeni]RNI19532.1 GNAT family N-acetyltransferase [Flexivirga caeni]
MSKQAEIRTANAADVAAVVGLVESAYRGQSSRAGWTTEADLLDGQRTDATEVAELVARGAVLVAVVDDALVACCQLEKRISAAYFGMFAVSPTLQGAGIGGQLMAYAERYAERQWSSTRMEMTVLRQRTDLIAFYERRGYYDTGTRSPFPYGDERFGIPRRDDLEFTLLTKQLGRPASSPENRVHRFIVEYETQWEIAAPAFDRRRDTDETRDRFEIWGELMAQTTRNHFTDPTSVRLARSFSNPAEYGPEVEQFVRSEVQDDVARVLTKRTSPLTKFREYTLHAQGPDWRISAISEYFGEPTQPFEDRATVDARLRECAADAPLAELPQKETHLDETRNFTDRDADLDGQTTRAQVERVGALVSATGVLSVVDFGYDNDNARPLARTVRPGAYPVERVTAFECNAAVRVRFSEEPPVAWRPASLPGSGHVVGVDAGCVCIVDYAGYATMTRRAKAAAYDRFTATPYPRVLEFPLGNGDTGVACDSGFGDGGYPIYWGLDAQGRTAQLVVDFMVLVAEDDGGAFRHL